jgi:hypothetical protein
MQPALGHNACVIFDVTYSGPVSQQLIRLAWLAVQVANGI